MQYENITRLIEAASPDQLLALARLALKLSDYAASRITDGPYDGGIDLVVKDASGGALPLAVTVSVERDWQKKLRNDVDKVRQKLGIQQVLFISSRRVPEGTFRPVQTRLRDATGVHVERLDQQGIADLVMDRGALDELLGVLDIRLDPERLPSSPVDRRRDAAYAYAFFSPEARSFRKAVRDRSLVVALAQAGATAAIKDLCEDACRLLGMSIEDAPSLRHDVDRLRGQGLMHGRNGTVVLADKERVTMDALRALREREETALRDELRSHIEQAGLSAPDEVLELLMGGLGALLARHIGAPKALDDLHTHVRELRRELHSFGLPDGGRGDRFIEQAIELGRSSELGQSLAVGSIYQALMHLSRDALLIALNARSTAFVLDASVAIPMFCALFHGSVQHPDFFVAEELHRRARVVGVALQLPGVWLEEMASHLLEARDYAGLVGDEDLRQSRNAYVAYFTAARGSGAGDFGDFDNFLAQFGLTESLGRRAGVDHAGARRELEVFLHQQLVHYGIVVVPTPTSKPHLDRASKDWDWACHDLGIQNRAPILANHDRRVLAWLSATVEHDPTHAPFIITKDRVLRRARPDSAPGGALDPLATSELLSFVAGTREPSMTARFAALQLTEAEAEQGAAILDALVKIEHTALSDAGLAQKARAFKQAYVRDQAIQSSATVLERAWRTFQTAPPE